MGGQEAVNVVGVVVGFLVIEPHGGSGEDLEREVVLPGRV